LQINNRSCFDVVALMQTRYDREREERKRKEERGIQWFALAVNPKPQSPQEGNAAHSWGTTGGEVGPECNACTFWAG